MKKLKGKLASPLIGAIQMPSLLSITTKVPLYSLLHHSLITHRPFLKHQCFTFLFIYLLRHADLSLQGPACLVGVIGLSSCSMWAYLLQGLWDLSSWTRNQPSTPCIASRFLTSGLPGKFLLYFSNTLPVFNHYGPHNTKNRPY